MSESIQRTDHGSFEMSNLFAFSIWWCWHCPLHQVTLLDLPELLRNMPFTWGKCTLSPLLFQLLSRFSINRFRHSGMVLFSGWAVWGTFLPLSRVREGRTDTWFSRQEVGKWAPYSIQQPNWFLRHRACESGSFRLRIQKYKWCYSCSLGTQNFLQLFVHGSCVN